MQIQFKFKFCSWEIFVKTSLCPPRRKCPIKTRLPIEGVAPFSLFVVRCSFVCINIILIHIYHYYLLYISHITQRTPINKIVSRWAQCAAAYSRCICCGCCCRCCRNANNIVQLPKWRWHLFCFLTRAVFHLHKYTRFICDASANVNEAPVTIAASVMC